MKTILIIDDEEALRANLRDMLGFEGFNVIEAGDGLVGLQKAQNEQPDLIICDVVMPSLNGYEVLQELRKDPNTRPIPFILLSAKTEKVAADHGLALGANEYFFKPYVFPDLLKALQDLIA